MRIQTLGLTVVIGAAALAASACDDGTTAVEPETVLLSVTPAGGAQDVDAGATTIEVSFDHPMHDHATDYMAVHEGEVTGPEVMGSWMMQDGATVMRFVPEAGLKEGTRYTIHLGGGLEDAGGHRVDLATHGMSMGGLWADGTMMHGGMMGGDHPHTGEGWRHPENGSYGMVFGFTTAA